MTEKISFLNVVLVPPVVLTKLCVTGKNIFGALDKHTGKTLFSAFPKVFVLHQYPVEHECGRTGHSDNRDRPAL